MRFTTRNEIEYLGSIDRDAAADPKLINDMWQRLDALRRYDQNVSERDWHPRTANAGCGTVAPE